MRASARIYYMYACMCQAALTSCAYTHVHSQHQHRFGHWCYSYNLIDDVRFTRPVASPCESAGGAIKLLTMSFQVRSVRNVCADACKGSPPAQPLYVKVIMLPSLMSEARTPRLEIALSTNFVPFGRETSRLFAPGFGDFRTMHSSFPYSSNHL